jgi:micrococcal nuclease
MYTYNCIIKRIVDGDTVDVDIDLGFDTWLHNVRVRLPGIDAPESRTRDLTEKYYGNLATQFVEQNLTLGKQYVLFSKEFNATDAFGRVLGDFQLEDGRSLVSVLLQSHHAVHWNPDNRTGMQEQHLANQRILAEQGFKPKE